MCIVVPGERFAGGGRLMADKVAPTVSEVPRHALSTNFRDLSTHHEHGAADGVSHILAKKMWDGGIYAGRK